MLEAGLIQRVKALNAFLYDIYHEKKIVSDGVVPKEFTYESKGYMRDTETLLQVEWMECRNHHCSDSRSLRFRSIISPSVFPKYPPIFPSERMTLWQGTSGANGFFLNA